MFFSDLMGKEFKTATVALRFAVAHQQAEGERVDERELLEAGRGRPGGGDAATLERVSLVQTFDA